MGVVEVAPVSDRHFLAGQPGTVLFHPVRQSTYIGTFRLTAIFLGLEVSTQVSAHPDFAVVSGLLLLTKVAVKVNYAAPHSVRPSS